MGVALGPRPTGDALPLPDELVVKSRQGDPVPIPSDVLMGLLGPFNGRARQILLSLLAGHSMGMAAASAGLSKSGLDVWRQRDQAFADAITMAYDMGFAANIEAEAYDRAMDREDRASGRLLELILKARSNPGHIPPAAPRQPAPRAGSPQAAAGSSRDSPASAP